jgi:SnoaL-like domain
MVMAGKGHMRRKAAPIESWGGNYHVSWGVKRMKNLEEAVQTLIDQRDIEKVITTYARAVDRLDVELLKSCYHPDAINHNAVSRVTAREFADIIVPQMRKLFSGTMHHVTHINVELKGTTAATESYFIAWHMVVGGYEEVMTFFGAPYAKEMESSGELAGGHDFIGGGRYLDRFEKRDGIWRIAERRVTMEWNHFGPVSKATPDSLFGRIPAWAKRDRSDLVYSVFKLD